MNLKKWKTGKEPGGERADGTFRRIEDHFVYGQRNGQTQDQSRDEQRKKSADGAENRMITSLEAAFEQVGENTRDGSCRDIAQRQHRYAVNAEIAGRTAEHRRRYVLGKNGGGKGDAERR